MPKKYYCSKCDHFHVRGDIYEEHKEYKTDPPKNDDSGNDSTGGSENVQSKAIQSSLTSKDDDLTPLRHINLSGGLFTENILLRLRDNPEQLEIGKIESFIEEDTRTERKRFKDERRKLFEWCIEKWDEISPHIDDWSREELIEKWLNPLFSQFGYEIEPFEMRTENIDGDSPLAGFEINFQSKGHENPFFHFVGIQDDFECKIEENPKKSTHHAICQQFVNFNPEIKWLFLSNGRMLRLLTTYYHTYSKGYIEFDLENIFANRDVKEFNTIYSLIHESRFIAKPEDQVFLIDEFQQEAVKEGVKVGDSLRDNVHDALELLGDELIQQNSEFLDLVLSEGIDLMEYYAELLRIIYRIIFILYAEQREMLPGAGSLYFEEFSLSALRMMAEKPIRAEKNYDLWNKLFLTCKLVGKGSEFLGINSYDGALFDDKNLSIIKENNLKISNDTLLKVVRLLTTTESNNIRQRINFLEIREEEIGAIYESLLDYKPFIDENSQFQLIEGTERKSTGSYYTPKELIDILIRTTLQPLVEDRFEEAGEDLKDQENAIMNIKVCDPACGGGTFLLSALDFLGKQLAEIRTGQDSPLENDLRVARRDVLQHCIYGVDMNPLAVELAKISLWLRASVKDKPLNFLDNHIKCGNSLIGLGQKMKIEKIKPKAFKAIKGNKSTGIEPENNDLQNKARGIIRDEIKERKKAGQTTMITSFLTQKKTADIFSAKFQEIIDMSEEDPDKIREKEARYESLKENEQYQQALDEANIWTSTFFWPFEGNVLGNIPSYTIIEQLREGKSEVQLKDLMQKVDQIAEENQFFHWYAEFPEVFSSERGGFDCILTNPPWETLRLMENEFFSGLSKEITSAKTQSERRSLIKNLKEKNIDLFDKYKTTWQSMQKQNYYISTSGLFDLSSQGTINTYALFVERSWRLISSKGYTGIVCPTGIIMNYYMQDLFRTLVNNNAFLSIFDFENRNQIFNIHRQFRFSLIALGGREVSQEIIPMAFNTLKPSDIQESMSI
ncbi:MAG: N-6 DNA methylase, partial [Candidatus Lokiarchaeota archaeon]|nr:N-6 DNA methylase [Candidatus Lokiarchaeota archaeon]